jgi:hypothetical protein
MSNSFNLRPSCIVKSVLTQFLRRMVHCTRFSGRRFIFADEVSRLMRLFRDSERNRDPPKFSYIAFVFRATNLICPMPKTSSTLQAVAEQPPTPGTFEVRLRAVRKLLQAANQHGFAREAADGNALQEVTFERITNEQIRTHPTSAVLSEA